MSMNIPADWEMKAAAGDVISVFEQSKNVGTALYTLSALLGDMAGHGGELSETRCMGCPFWWTASVTGSLMSELSIARVSRK